MFTDFVGFTTSAGQLAAEDLVALLHEYFTVFDEITKRHGLEKMKTVGDSYMCIGGLPMRNPSHAVDTVLAALEMARYVKERPRSHLPVEWAMRVGIHTGPVVAGVVGTLKFAFRHLGRYGELQFPHGIERSSQSREYFRQNLGEGQGLLPNVSIAGRF